MKEYKGYHRQQTYEIFKSKLEAAGYSAEELEIRTHKHSAFAIFLEGALIGLYYFRSERLHLPDLRIYDLKTGVLYTGKNDALLYKFSAIVQSILKK